MWQSRLRHSRSFMILSCAQVLVALTLTATGAVAQNVDGANLSNLFSDGDVVFQLSGRDAPGWVSAQWRFLPDGSLTGYLFSSAYIPGRKPLKGLDNGGWWVKGNKLCVQWSEWSDGEKRCYEISGKGAEYTASGDKGMLAGRFTIIK